jgi:endoglucanase
MRYNHNIITSTSDFQTWWKNLAAEFKDDKNVIFDLQNEPWVREFVLLRATD